MIYDVRTYTLYPRMTKKYVELFEQFALPVQQRHGFRLVAYLTSRIGSLNEVVHIWAYESLAELERMREKRDADPEWGVFLEKTNGLALMQEDKIMAPVSFSPLK